MPHSVKTGIPEWPTRESSNYSSRSWRSGPKRRKSSTHDPSIMIYSRWTSLSHNSSKLTNSRRRREKRGKMMTNNRKKRLAEFALLFIQNMPLPYKIALVGKNTDDCRDLIDMMKRNDPSIDRISENHLRFVFVTSENPEVAR